MGRAGRLARLGQLLDSLEEHAPTLMSKSDKRVVKIGLLFKSRSTRDLRRAAQNFVFIVRGNLARKPTGRRVRLGDFYRRPGCWLTFRLQIPKELGRANFPIRRNPHHHLEG
jgi:hypothetical protein